MNTKVVVMAVIALAVIGLAAFQFTKKPTEQAATTKMVVDGSDANDVVMEASMTLTPTPTGTENVVDVSDLKNGTYEAVGTYTSPAGKESIEVTVTLEDGIITDAQVEPQAVNEVSKKMQASFKEGFGVLVVGKPISEVKLGKVSASSLTSGGFNEALQKIMTEAKG